MFDCFIRSIYPNSCGYCGKIIKDGYICDKCRKNLNSLKIHTLNSNGYYFNKLICLYKYDGIVRKKILEFKFHNKKYLCRTFAEDIIEALKNEKEKFDFLIPVPISILRYFQRGFNQSEIICIEVSKKLNLKINTKILKKFKDNKKQSLLSKSDRESNVKGVYKIKNAFEIKGKSILLLDDIYTTGATVNECSKILKQSGASKVTVITIAKGERKWMN